MGGGRGGGALLTELFPFFRLRQTVGTLCAQLPIQFYTGQFESLQEFLSWSVAMYVDNLIFVTFFDFERSHLCPSIRYALHMVRNG